jgi:hypothetical protein
MERCKKLNSNKCNSKWLKKGNKWNSREWLFNNNFNNLRLKRVLSPMSMELDTLQA